MIDVHTHILPGLDDGAQSWDDALAMARHLSKAGFTQVIATPHVLEGRRFIAPDIILDLVAQLNQRLQQAEISLLVLPGAENYIFPDLPRYAREGRLVTLGGSGKYLLLELPMLELPNYTDEIFFELQLAGVIPVLAHPERYPYVYDEPELITGWIRNGILCQLDLQSLSGRYGEEARQMARRLVKNDLIQLLGTDMHRIVRGPELYEKEYQTLYQLIGESALDILNNRNPGLLITGADIPHHEPEPGLTYKVQKGKLLKRLLSLGRPKR